MAKYAIEIRTEDGTDTYIRDDKSKAIAVFLEELEDRTGMAGDDYAWLVEELFEAAERHGEFLQDEWDDIEFVIRFED